jgi:anti-sigma28 factor (negative regulator of flagellin synthesis)
MDIFVQGNWGTAMNSKKATEKLARELDAIRYRKIRKIKDRICSGTYRVSNKLLAKALFVGE